MTDVVDGVSVGNKIGKTDKVMTDKIMTESVVVNGAPVGDRVGKVDMIMTDRVIEDGASIGDRRKAYYLLCYLISCLLLEPSFGVKRRETLLRLRLTCSSNQSTREVQRMMML